MKNQDQTRLTILRHGPAIEADGLRMLSPVGEIYLTALSQSWISGGNIVHLVLTSPELPALQTARILAGSATLIEVPELSSLGTDARRAEALFEYRELLQGATLGQCFRCKGNLRELLHAQGEAAVAAIHREIAKQEDRPMHVVTVMHEGFAQMAAAFALQFEEESDLHHRIFSLPLEPAEIIAGFLRPQANRATRSHSSAPPPALSSVLA